MINKETEHNIKRMKGNFKIVDSIENNKWAEFVKCHQNGNFFQSPEAFSFFGSVKNYVPIKIFCVDSEGELLGILVAVIQKEMGIKGYFSRRCIVWGGPLLSEKMMDTDIGVIKSQSNKVLEALLDELIKKVKKKAIYIEIRNLFDTSKFDEIFLLYKFKFKEHLNFIVKLENAEDVKKQMSESKFRQVKKSIKAGAKIVTADTEQDVKEFYKHLSKLYSEKVKKPLPDYSYFKNFFWLTTIGKFLLIIYNNKIIGGIMCAIYKDTIFELYINGEDGKYQNIYPSVMATYAAIDFGLKNGIKYFDFLGAGKPNEDYGVREFKSKFGGKLVNFGRYKFINNALLYKTGEIGLKYYGLLKK